MRRLILAALGVFAVAGVASAQQPQSQQPPVPSPTSTNPPVATAAGVSPAGGCSSCGTAPASGFGSNIRGAFFMASGGNCPYGYGCQNGCGSTKSNLAFQFGSCKDFFDPCGPTCSGSLFGKRCGYTQFAKPYGTGWGCPKAYDSYANH